jgi:hypothetical protein
MDNEQPKKINFISILGWLKKQGEYAKTAWTVFLVVLALFGYQITKVPNDSIVVRLTTIEKELKADPNTDPALTKEIEDVLSKINKTVK